MNRLIHFQKTQPQAMRLFSGVFFMLGIACYWGIGFAIPVLYPLILTGLCGGLLYFKRRKAGTHYALNYAFCFMLGLAVVACHTAFKTQVRLTREVKTSLTATVEKYEKYPQGGRLTLKDVVLADGRTLPRVRVYTDFPDPLMLGTVIQAKARLRPVRPAPVPGAYDFLRIAWYQGISAGGKLTEIERQHIPEHIGFKGALEAFRRNLMRRIYQVQDKNAASVTIPLILGEQSLVPDEIQDLYRTAGITHVLSVSGFHLSLLAVFIFMLVRKGLALFPRIALFYNTKKWAAIIAWIVSYFYLLISGLQVPAVRSFIMISFVFLAVLTDRRAISLQTCMQAACLILFFSPQSLLSPSFQLSFMAVFALTSVYQAVLNHMKAPWDDYTFLGKVKLVVLGGLWCDVLACAVSAFYTIYHFQQFSPYAVIGTTLTNAVFSLAIMPLLVFGVAFYPLHIDAPVWMILEKLLHYVEQVCRWIQTLPGADLTLPALTTAGLMCATLGWLWVFFVRGKIRALGLVAVVAGFCLRAPVPQAIISPDFTVGVYQKDWRFYGRFLAPLDTAVWMRRTGHHPFVKDKQRPFMQAFYVGPYRVALNKTYCPGSALCLLRHDDGRFFVPVLTPEQAKAQGGFALYATDKGLKVRSLGQIGGHYPWTEHFFVSF